MKEDRLEQITCIREKGGGFHGGNATLPSYEVAPYNLRSLPIHDNTIRTEAREWRGTQNGGSVSRQQAPERLWAYLNRDLQRSWRNRKGGEKNVRKEGGVARPQQLV